MDDDTMYGLLDADQLWQLYATADLIRSRICADTKWSMDDVRAMNEVCVFIKEAARVEEREEVRRKRREQEEGFADYVRKQEEA